MAVLRSVVLFALAVLEPAAALLAPCASPARASHVRARAVAKLAVDTREDVDARTQKEFSPIKFAMRRFKGVVERVRTRSWRSAAAIKDALITADLMRSQNVAMPRYLPENTWEETLLPTMHVATSRNLAEIEWEARCLPALDRLGGGRRDLAENSWEDRLIPGPAPRLVRSTRNLAGWEDRLLPAEEVAAAARDLDECGWEDRLLP